MDTITYGKNKKILNLKNKNAIWFFLLEHKVQKPFKAIKCHYQDIVDKVYENSIQGEYGFTESEIEALKRIPLYWWNLVSNKRFTATRQSVETWEVNFTMEFVDKELSEVSPK